MIDSPGAERSIAALVLEKNESGPAAADGGDGEHVRQRGRELERVALVELVAGGGDGHDAARDGDLERDVLGEAEAARAVAHVDHRRRRARSPRAIWSRRAPAGDLVRQRDVERARARPDAERSRGRWRARRRPRRSRCRASSVSGNCRASSMLPPANSGCVLSSWASTSAISGLVGVTGGGDERRVDDRSRASRPAAPTAGPGRRPGAARRAVGLRRRRAGRGARSAPAKRAGARAGEHVAAGAGRADRGAAPNAARERARRRAPGGRRRSRCRARRRRTEAATASPGSVIGRLGRVRRRRRRPRPAGGGRSGGATTRAPVTRGQPSVATSG